MGRDCWEEMTARGLAARSLTYPMLAGTLTLALACLLSNLPEAAAQQASGPGSSSPGSGASALTAGYPRDPGAAALGAPPVIAPRSSLYLPGISPTLERLSGSRGLRVGAFGVTSTASTGLAYDDNIEADEDDREGDLIWATGAGVRAQSLLRRHSLGLQASAGTSQYLNHQEEGGINWLLSADGRLDLDRHSDLSGAISYTRDKEDPAEVDDTDDEEGGGDVFDQVSSGLSYSRRFRRLTWILDGTAGRTEFEDSDASEDDRWTLGASTRVGYDVGRRLTLWLGPNFTRTLYDGPPDDEDDGDEGDEDSESASLNLGASYEINPRLSAYGSIGYGWRFYDDPERESTGDVLFAGGLAGGFPLDDRTQLTLSVDRSISETDDEDASSAIRTSGTLGLTRILRRDMTLGADVGVTRSAFEDDDRLDHTLRASLSYGWALTERLFLNAGYRYTQRFSKDGGEDYYRNIFLIGFSVRLL
jgi:hypothetical protein